MEKFVEIWKTDIQQQSSSPLISDMSETPSADVRSNETLSRKRSRADAGLPQHISTPPILRPVHIVQDTPNSEERSDSTTLDETIENRFIGERNNI